MRTKTLIGSLEPKFNPFDADYLAEILAATTLAWARMEPPGQNEIEDRITERLAGRLANDPHFAELPYDIVPQYWLLGLMVNGSEDSICVSSTAIRNVTILHLKPNGFMEVSEWSSVRSTQPTVARME